MFDSKIQKLKDHFGIFVPEDWAGVRPEWILAQDGCGPVLLDHIRLYLCIRNITLCNDRTPEFWRNKLQNTRIGHIMGDLDDGPDQCEVTPFTILVDTAEDQPWTFIGINNDENGHPWIVQTETRSLGRHPDQMGDYSLDGHAGVMAIERKSVSDCISTILGFGGNRDRFEHELSRMQQMKSAAVIVEGSMETVLASVQQRGKKSTDELRSIVFRSILAFMQDYRVPWLFSGNRRIAEIAAFRFLHRYWRKHIEASKSESRVAKSA